MVLKVLLSSTVLSLLKGLQEEFMVAHVAAAVTSMSSLPNRQASVEV